MKRGAADIAVRGERAMAPGLIRCEPATPGKGAKWWRAPPRRVLMRLDVQADLAVDTFTGNGVSDVMATPADRIFAGFFLLRSAKAMLELEVKELMIDVLQLEDITPADIDSAAPLFVDGLGLDSIDALELGVALQKKYGLFLSADPEETRRHFTSVSALVALIESHRTK
jgi:acyl carrier protein